MLSGWTGLARIWRVPDCQMELSVAAHDDRITGVAWHPHVNQSSPVAFATGSADQTAKLWNAQGTSLLSIFEACNETGEMLHTLTGHTERLGRITFHPMGAHLASASFDTTWRFWDLETGKCLMEQEGHSRAVYTVAFQCDGSLAASGGLDAIGMLSVHELNQKDIFRSNLGLSNGKKHSDTSRAYQEDSRNRFRAERLLFGNRQR